MEFLTNSKLPVGAMVAEFTMILDTIFIFFEGWKSLLAPEAIFIYHILQHTLACAE